VKRFIRFIDYFPGRTLGDGPLFSAPMRY